MDGLVAFSTYVRARLSRRHFQFYPCHDGVPRKRCDDFQIAQSGMGGERDDGAIWLKGLEATGWRFSLVGACP